MKHLKDWQKIGKISSILWLLGAVLFATKTVGEDRLKFREIWYETCLSSNKSRIKQLQKHKYLDTKNDECFTQARQESITAIPDYVLIRNVGFWGILPILLGWLLSYKLLRSKSP